MKFSYITPHFPLCVSGKATPVTVHPGKKHPPAEAGGCSENLLFQFGPVAGLAKLGPLLELVLLGLVVVAVGSLLYVQIEPLRNVRVVAPLDHIVVQILFGLGETLEDAVDERHCLGTGDLVVRTEGTVGITGDPAVVGGGADLVLRPVGRDVAEISSRRVGLVVKTGCDSRELSAGDRRIRIELAVRALHDAHSAQRRNGVVVPCTGCYVGVAVGLGRICIAGLVGQQTEEDGRDLSAGDAVLRTDGLVRVADDVSIVIVTVQTGRYIIRNGNGRSAVVAATGAAAAAVLRVGVGEYGVLLNLVIIVRGRIPCARMVAGVRLVANGRDTGDRNHNGFVFERFAGFLVLELNVSYDVSVAAVVPAAVYNLECKTVLPSVRDVVAALDVKVVVQVDGNVLGQLFKVIGNGGQTGNVNVGLAVDRLFYSRVLVKLGNSRVLNSRIGRAVLYLNLNALLVVEVLVDGIGVLSRTCPR